MELDLRPAGPVAGDLHQPTGQPDRARWRVSASLCVETHQVPEVVTEFAGKAVHVHQCRRHPVDCLPQHRDRDGRLTSLDQGVTTICQLTGCLRILAPAGVRVATAIPSQSVDEYRQLLGRLGR